MVELLVATAITAVLAGLLITITTGVMNVWNRSRGSLTTSNQVKLALDQLAVDLEGAIMRNDGNVWFAATILESNNALATTTAVEFETDRGWEVGGSGPFPLKPESDPASLAYDERNLKLDARAIEDCSFGRAGVWLRFFAVRRGSNENGASLSTPVAVSYQLCRRRVGSGNDDEIAYMLYRAVVRDNDTGTGTEQSKGTFQIGYDLDPNSGNAYTDPSGNREDPGNVVLPNAIQVIANHVIDFGVRLYIREGRHYRLIFPAKASSQSTSISGDPSTSPSTAANELELSHLVTSTSAAFDPGDIYRHVAPDLVEVMIRVLSDEGAARIQALEAGLITGDWWDIALAHSHVYTRRIEIKGRPL